MKSALPKVLNPLCGQPMLEHVLRAVAPLGSITVVIGAGMSGILLSRRSADPYNPKAVRASAGSVMNIPLFTGLDPARSLGLLKNSGYRVVAAVPRAGACYWDHGWEERTVVLLGNEAWGIPDEDLRLADTEVHVPLFGKAESLNVATAAALMFYEIRRRTETGHGKDDL